MIHSGKRRCSDSRLSPVQKYHGRWLPQILLGYKICIACIGRAAAAVAGSPHPQALHGVGAPHLLVQPPQELHQQDQGLGSLPQRQVCAPLGPVVATALNFGACSNATKQSLWLCLHYVVRDELLGHRHQEATQPSKHSISQKGHRPAPKGMGGGAIPRMSWGSEPRINALVHSCLHAVSPTEHAYGRSLRKSRACRHLWKSATCMHQCLDGDACRWGNAQSPAYGTLSDYQFMRRHSTNAKHLEKARQQWGKSLSSVEDVISVFVNYTSGAGPFLPQGQETWKSSSTKARNQATVTPDSQAWLTPAG